MAASINAVLSTLDGTQVQHHRKHIGRNIGRIIPPNHTLETYLAKYEMLLVDLRNIPPKHTSETYLATYPETYLQVKHAALFVERPI